MGKTQGRSKREMIRNGTVTELRDTEETVEGTVMMGTVLGGTDILRAVVLGTTMRGTVMVVM